ncbi:MAG: JAB domain-containing protein [Sphingomicrobium sp.]
MRYQRAEPPARLNGHDAASRFFAHCFESSPPANGATSDNKARHDAERLWVAHPDAEARCMQLSSHDGGPESVDLPVRDIINDAARLGSAGIVLAHNHPSGDASPSEADCRATRRLALAAEAIDLAIVDHLVFGAGECRSFRRMGLL